MGVVGGRLSGLPLGPVNLVENEPFLSSGELSGQDVS
jgi:hypothetical protein